MEAYHQSAYGTAAYRLITAAGYLVVDLEFLGLIIGPDSA